MKSLTNFELEKLLAKQNVNINGIVSKNELPATLKRGWYIINLMDSDAGSGSHWCCFKYDNAHLIYYDSMGFEPPLEVLDVAKNDILYSNNQIQNEMSSSCGWFCIVCILNDQVGLSDSVTKFKQFLSRFQENTHINEHILQKLVVHYGLI